jgi:nitrogen fixation/metabolism regulation signal transduction histidine kinase
MTKPERVQQQKRKLRNYLLDVGLQLRFTVFILAIAVFLTAFLGYRIYVATQESTRIVIMTAAVDPASEHELRAQFQANDRVVLWSIVGFGAILLVTVTAAGIWMTHKIAGPLHNIGLAFARVRDNRLPPDLRTLRKGDELHAFHASFREMYEAIRARALTDRDALEKAISAIEAQPSRTAALESVLAEMRALQRDKVESLSPQK